LIGHLRQFQSFIDQLRAPDMQREISITKFEPGFDPQLSELL